MDYPNFVKDMHNMLRNNPGLIDQLQQCPWFCTMLAKNPELDGILKDKEQNVTATTTKLEQNVLHVASQGGHYSVCQFLLQNGACVNEVDETGGSALYASDKNGHLAVCGLLIKHGANVNQTNNDGLSALLISAQHGHLPVCDLLIQSRANANDVDKEGCNAMMISGQYGHFKVCTLLCEK